MVEGASLVVILELLLLPRRFTHLQTDNTFNASSSPQLSIRITMFTLFAVLIG